jgi:nucleoside phosphorylase
MDPFCRKQFDHGGDAKLRYTKDFMSKNPVHVLVTAAMGFEERPISEGIKRSENHSYEVLRSGVGQKAGDALRERLAQSFRRRPSLVISSGLAGIELPGISIGSWLLGTNVHASDARPELITLHEPIAAWIQSAGIEFRLADFRSATEVVQVDHQLELKRGAVDMESYSLALVCQEENIPFAILRIVSDTPDSPLPKAIGAFVKVATEETWAGKLQGVVSGIRATFHEPKAMGRFVSQSPKLSRKLTQGWEKLARRELKIE